MEEQEVTLIENLVAVNRIAKVVKGGKRLRFSALVVVGDGKGSVGVGTGKAGEVAQAIQKAGIAARKDMTEVTLLGSSIPHQIESKYGAARILLKPAVPGTGVIAGKSARAVLQAAGVKDVLTKSLGSPNPLNLVRATKLGLTNQRLPQEVIAKRKPTPSGSKKDEPSTPRGSRHK
jgi:small subunit ribosomal protein S5